MNGLVKFLAKDLIIFVALVFLWVWARQRRHQKSVMLISVILAGIIAVVLSKIASKLYYHPRPFTVQHVSPLVAHNSDNGFPSDHTTLAMTLTAVIYFYRQRFAVLALILTLLVGAGRVWAHVHYPVDILGGLVIGVIAGWIGYQLTVRIVSGRAAGASNSFRAPRDEKPRRGVS